MVFLHFNSPRVSVIVVFKEKCHSALWSFLNKQLFEQAESMQYPVTNSTHNNFMS